MFNSDAGRDPHSSKLTRRVFAGGAVAAVASFGIARLFQSPGVEASPAVHGSSGQVKIASFKDDGTPLEVQTVPKIVKTDGEWYKQLGSNSFNIARKADTEMPFSGVTWKEHGHGLYRCICCETALFSSATKFESGTGWPSFYAPIAKENVVEKKDDSMGMDRTEVQCARCEGHLGHVFSDGPEPTGLRYCMNSASMHFVKA
jgi:peptide-methionine (R)-S-oxide reductase